MSARCPPHFGEPDRKGRGLTRPNFRGGPNPSRDSADVPRTKRHDDRNGGANANRHYHSSDDDADRCTRHPVQPLRQRGTPPKRAVELSPYPVTSADSHGSVLITNTKVCSLETKQLRSVRLSGYSDGTQKGGCYDTSSCVYRFGALHGNSACFGCRHINAASDGQHDIA
jgi:hypothetical protein